MSNTSTNVPANTRPNMPIIRQQSSLLPSDPAALDALGAGIPSSFPVISIDGRKWTIKFDGREQTLLDHRNEPALEFEAVILDCPLNQSKTYYDKPFGSTPGQGPRCRSIDGIVPDRDIIDPIAPTCARCPNNERGSRIYQGKALKACSDNKRLIVAPASDIRNEEWGGPALLRVPAGSLKPLRLYGDDLRESNALFYGCVTRIRFAPGMVHQKLLFEYVRPLTDDEVRDVLTLKSGRAIKRIMVTEPAAIDPSLASRVVDEETPPIEEGEVQGSDVHQDPVQSPANPVGFGKPPPSPYAVQRPAGGIPPQPGIPPAPTPEKAAQQPAARAVTPPPPPPRSLPQASARPATGGRPTVSVSTKPQSEIGDAIKAPAEPPASQRQVVAPPIPDEDKITGEAGVPLPDELDMRFGALLK